MCLMLMVNKIITESFSMVAIEQAVLVVQWRSHLLRSYLSGPGKLHIYQSFEGDDFQMLLL